MPRNARPFLLASLFAVACAPVATRATRATAAGEAALPPVVPPSEPREQTADQQVQHVLNRLGFGPRPGDVARVRAMGVDRWVAQQLSPKRIDDGATDSLVSSAFETYHVDTHELVSLAQANQRAIRERTRMAAQQGDTASRQAM